MHLSSASVPDSHNRNVGVAEMETPKLWGNVLDPHFFISSKPMRSIYIKDLYSIIFNIRALIYLLNEVRFYSNRCNRISRLRHFH